MAVLIPVYTVKGWFTTCVHPTMYVCLLLVGDHSPLPITLPSVVSELFSGILSVSLHISTATEHVKCFIEHVLHIVPGICMHNLRAGPYNTTFYKHTYIHTLAQILTPHCTIISLASHSAIILLSVA